MSQKIKIEIDEKGLQYMLKELQRTPEGKKIIDKIALSGAIEVVK